MHNTSVFVALHSVKYIHWFSGQKVESSCGASGGKRKKVDEDARATALRELEEETAGTAKTNTACWNSCSDAEPAQSCHVRCDVHMYSILR